MSNAPSLSKTPPATAVRRRLLGAASWSTGGHVLSQVIRFGSNLALTRLVAPDAFGLMLLATSICVAVALLSDAGFHEVVVRSPRGQDRDFLNTVWSLHAVRGVLLMAVGLAVAGGLWLAEQRGYRISGAYDDPRFPSVLALLSVGFAIQGFQSTRLWLAYRRMDLGSVVRFEFVAQLVGLATTFGWAALDPSVWAMVAGMMASSLTHVVLTHLALPGDADRFCIEPAAAREVARFARWIWLSSLVTVLATQFDKLFFGAVAEPTWLGQLSLAVGMVSALEGVIGRVTTSLALPYFADILRTDRAAATRRFADALIAIDAGAFLLAGLLYSMGPLIVDVLYADAYAGAGWMLSVLAALLLTTRTHLSKQFLLALDRGALVLAASIAKTVALVACVVAGHALHGVDGALLGVALHAAIFYFVTVCIDVVSGARVRPLNAASLATLLVGVSMGHGFVALLGH